MRRVLRVSICLAILGGLVPRAAAQVGRYPAEQTVTIRITGITDENARKYVLDRLPALLESKSHSQRASTRNNVTTVLLAPVKDVQAFADKIDFGEATVNGRTITVKAKKLDVPTTGSDALTKALFDIKSPNVLTRVGALDKLATLAMKSEKQGEVTKAVEPLLKHSDVRTARAAAKALGVWGTKDSVSALAEATQAKDPFTRREAMAALGKLKDERSAEIIAKRLTDGLDRFEATKTLQSMGPMAEGPMGAYLTHSDWTVRNEACKVLGVVGTKKSIEALQKAAKSDENFIIRQEAGKALDSVKSRSS